MLRPHRTKPINHQPPSFPLNTKHLTLTALRITRRRAFCVVVVEEAVQTRAVDDRAPSVEEAEAQRVAVSGEAASEIWILEGGVGLVGAVEGVWVGLVVGGFGLDEADEDGVGVGELVLV